MLKKNPLLLSANDNKLNLSHISEINKGIISIEDFDKSLILKEKDLNLFYLILKLTDNNSLTMIDFIVKNTKKEFKKKEIEKKNEFKIFLLKQLLLLFKYLSLNEERNTKKYYELITELYHLIFKVHNSLKIIQINDIIEIIRYNIIISLDDLINQNYIFNCSINVLIDFYKHIIVNENKDEGEIKTLNISLIKLFETLYNHLINNKKSLLYLQRYKDMQNLSLFNIIIFYNINTENKEDENIKKINDIINKIILLVYSFNSSKLINEIILSDIKEGFFELKKGNDTVIKNIINLLSNKIHLVHNLYLNEKDILKNDLYQPKNYFVFNNSLYSGIDYNPQFDLFNYNFALIFSFKLSDNTKNYPLISFLSEKNQNNENEILLLISLQNKRIGILFQNEHQEFSNIEIQSNKSYLIVIEYYKNDVGFEKLKLIINNMEERKYINLGLIDYDKNILVKLGYLTEKIRLQSSSLENLSLNFSGIMGSVIIIPDIYNEFKDDIADDENDFATHLSRLKGFYDNMIYINKYYDLNYLYIYENFKLISDQRFIKANIYLNENANRSGRKEFYIISPLSIINAVDHNSKIFIDNINGFSKITKKAYIDTFYSTLEIPSNKTQATYAKLNINSLQSFVEYEGLHLLTLILEYHYNLLRMIIDDSQYDNKLSIAFDINNALIPIINLMTNIIMFFQINLFSKELDTFGFSLMKVINLLGDIKAFNSCLINCIIDNIHTLLNFYNENISNTKISKIVRNFINKIFSLINNPKYYDSDNFEQMKKIFRLFHEILINNYDLMTSDTFVSILQFCFVLDLEIDEDDDEKEFKSMKGEYKSLIELIMKQNESIEFYLDYLKNVFQKNISIRIKYKLMKIYYKSNEVVSVLNNDLNEEKNDKIENKDNKDGKDKSFWKIFKSKKDCEKANINVINGDDLITRYDVILTKILAIRFQNNPLNEKYHELLKCIMIQLLYEQAAYLYKKNSEDQYCFFSEECISKKQNDIILGTNNLKDMIHPKSKSIKELAKLRKSSHLPEGYKTPFSSIFGVENEKKNSESVLYLFDKLLESNNISFHVIKSLFCCLFDKWDRNDKFNFFKSSTDVKYESFDANFGNFTKNKKVLISDFIDLITCINNQDTMKKSMNLIFSFLRKCISDFKSIKDDKNIQIYNIKYYKKKFYHLFESKEIMNKLFNFCLLSNNKYISEDLHESLLVNSINICNSVMEYHPRPFIFHFMKSSIKNKDVQRNIYPIFKGISEYIINNLKKDSDIIEKEKSDLSIEDSINKDDSLSDKEDKSDTEEIYSYLYYNEIRFVKCIIKIYKNNQFEMQKLLYNNDFKFLNSLLNLIIGFCSSKIIYDLKLYIFHPNSLIQDSKERLSFNSNPNSTMTMITSNSKEDEKLKDKYDIKLIQSSESKIISNQILFLNIMELIYLTIYLLCTFPVDENEANNQKILNHFIKAIFEKICIDDHFITYYLDILNQKNYIKIAQKENIPNSTITKCLEEMPFKYHHFLIKNSAVKDNRIFSALLFLKLLKYQNLLKIYQKNKSKENNPRVEMIKNVFSNHINMAQNDLISLSQIIEKIKDSKKVEVIFEKEELNNKNFKNFHRNYYKYLMSYINKFKNNEFFDNIKSDLEKKFIKEEEEKKTMKINWMNNSDANDSNSSLEESISISEMKLARNDEDYISLSKMNNSGQKNLLKRKDSYNNYYKDEVDTSHNRSRRQTSDYISTVSTNNPYGSYQTVNFIDAEEPVLCTKRDLALKSFGYYFFDEYFKDERFIKMKNYFMHLYPTTNTSNNYNGFEKQMKINYPSVLKNYSSCNNYYPRIFLRPDHTFFRNQNLYKSHEYLNVNISNSPENKNDDNSNDNMNIYNYITNEKENKILHFENGHGLLNQNNFNIFSAGNIKENLGIMYDVFECEYINNKNTIQGNIKLIRNFIIFQTNQNFDFSLYETNRKYRISSRKEEINQIPKQVIIPINLIEQIILRNFLFYTHAIEIFLYNGKSYFFNFYETTYCTDFINNLKIQYENCDINNLGDIFEIIENPIEYFNKKKFCNNWLDGKLPTLDYLLLINKYSGRSYNDLTQYIIFPWLLNNYSDVNNKNNFRKMNLSMAIQDKTNLESIKESYENDKDLIKRSHFQYHYSNSSYISLYLLRLNPFTYNQIKQNGHFDSPDRQLESMQDMCIIFKDFKETSELIPEYFFMVECFLNLNYNFFGKKSSEAGREQTIVNNIKLTSNFSSLLELVLFHYNFINSNEITGNVNKWIDIIFGENQLTNKKNVINTYPIDCYEKYVKEEIDQKVNELNECEADDSEGITNKIKKLIKDIKLKTDYAYLFGQCPPQIFQKTHPIFSLLKKSKRITVNYDENNLKIDTKITIPDKQLLYLSYKNGNNNLYILTSNKIWVYNKALRPMYSFEINKFNQPYFLNIDNNEMFLRFLYKNLIFEIDDCRIFFIGGYLDNSFKIYYKEKDNNDKETLSLSIVTESQVTCIKNIYGKNIIYTGHKNGKIMKWRYNLLSEKLKSKQKDDCSIGLSSIIAINKKENIIGHKSFVQIIDTNDNFNVLISASNDGFIFIRKIFDYELLNVIKYNPLKKSLFDLCFDKQFIIATYYNNKKNQKRIKINTYSLNGIKLSDEEQNISLPFILNQKTDEIVVFISGSIYKMKITFKEWEDLLINFNKNLDWNGAETDTKKFVHEIKQNTPVSLCYDENLKNIFCLFKNGQLYRINMKL